MKHIGKAWSEFHYHYQMRPQKTTSIFSSKFQIKVTSIFDVFVYPYAQDFLQIMWKLISFLDREN